MLQVHFTNLDMPKIGGWMVNSVDPDQMAHSVHLIWVYTFSDIIIIVALQNHVSSPFWCKWPPWVDASLNLNSSSSTHFAWVISELNTFAGRFVNLNPMADVVLYTEHPVADDCATWMNWGNFCGAHIQSWQLIYSAMIMNCMYITSSYQSRYVWIQNGMFGGIFHDNSCIIIIPAKQSFRGLYCFH